MFQKTVEIETNLDINHSFIEAALTHEVDRTGWGVDRSAGEYYCDKWFKVKKIHPAAGERHPASERPEPDKLLLLKTSKLHGHYRLAKYQQVQDDTFLFNLSGKDGYCISNDEVIRWAYINPPEEK